MIETGYKRILILGQPFNNSSGGGITLTNLFKGWPKEKIAVVSTGHLLKNITTDVCELFYQLGSEEQSWIFPFNILQKSFPSGQLIFTSRELQSQKRLHVNLRKTLVDRMFFPFIHWIGLFHSLSRISLSKKFKAWLSDYKPEILYMQISTREQILFSEKLIDYLNIPSVIHMMDDWPSTISKDGLLKDYWRKKIDKEYRQLLDRIDLYLSISEAMSSEYSGRYQKKFIPFHNPINVARYNKIKNRTFGQDKAFRILYMGRIGTANRQSVYLFSKVISKIQVDHYEIYLDIFTNDINSRESKPIENLRNVKISPAVNYGDVPGLLASYDLLLLPLDFSVNGLSFARFSMPTKASEYFISGTPVLVFAPGETAISKFCTVNDCGFCIKEESPEIIEEAIHFLISNEGYRQKISNNAIRLSKELFSEDRVREKFQNLLIETTKRQNYVQK